MPFVDNDDVMETLSADRAYESLTIGILPGRLRRANDFLDTHVLDALAEELTVDAIAISDQQSGRRIVRERSDDLLCRPCGSQVRSDVVVHDHAAVVAGNDEAEQNTERRCRNGRQIGSHDIANVVVRAIRRDILHSRASSHHSGCVRTGSRKGCHRLTPAPPLGWFGRRKHSVF